MTVSRILESAFTSLNQCFKSVILDFVWRFIWATCALLGFFSLWILLVSRLESMVWQGPELGARNPIMLLAALQAFWKAEGPLLVVAVVLFTVGMVLLWVVLEALFRGGLREFWIYFVTGLVRISILMTAAIFFLAVAGRDESHDTVFIALPAMLAMWFSVALLEAVIRRRATSLMATSFLKVAGVVGAVLLLEVVLLFLLAGAAALVVVEAAGSWLLVAGFFAVFVFLVWMIVHSYLIAVRYSAIDIMRRNVVGS